MDIHNPRTSRRLAILIQPVAASDRTRFISDAEKASDMKAFLAKYANYKKHNK
jgi:hypothetical protein